MKWAFDPEKGHRNTKIQLEEKQRDGNWKIYI